MGWQDRSYYRDSSDGTGRLNWLLNGSIPLYTAFGIHVRMHVSLLFLLVIGLVTAGAPGGMGWKHALTFDLVLFGIILLHEYGHCFAARRVGGEAKEILLWPLGGLAFADAPKRAWPQLVTVAGGPLVNLVICAITLLGLVAVQRAWPALPWNPLHSHYYPPDGGVAYYLWFIFVVSWGNFLFNVLIPVYPMDAWRVLQASLWFKLGYYRSMMISLAVGMAVAAPMALWGLITVFSGWYGMVLLIIGANGFYACYTMRTMMRAEGPWAFQEEDGIDYSASLFNNASAEPKTKHRKLNKRLLKRAQKRETDEMAEQETVDAILAKVSAHGMNSLSWFERRALKRATERQRKRDLELKSEMTRKGF